MREVSRLEASAQDGRFGSVLFGGPSDRPVLESERPPYFGDLNLEPVVDAITAGREEYDLKAFFYTRLSTVGAVAYRHEIFRDVEREHISACLEAFAEEMRRVRRYLDLATRLHYQQEREAWFLDAAVVYCDTVRRLADDLQRQELGSRGLRAFRSYLAAYNESRTFESLAADLRTVKAGLAGIRYLLNIRGRRAKVGRYAGAPDYGAEIERTFVRFRQGAVKDYRVSFRDSAGLNHVEAAVLALVAELHPAEFSALASFCDRHRDFIDKTIARFDREIEFYLAYLQYAGRIKIGGLQFCYPRVSARSKEVRTSDSFDLALAGKLVGEHSHVVTNDFHLSDPERIIVVSGPNQGGKTTFARMFGQLHHLAAIGCPVPGSDANLFLCDQLFTHFEKEEDATNLSGKLEDDLVRLLGILEQSTGQSVVIMNESVTSTTLDDARLLGRSVLEQMIERDLLCVYVTFIDELASLDEKTVSMVSTVLPDDPATRTFKVVRRAANGLAYAAAIADKHGLTYERIKRRVAA
jgi:hypothetical protein